MGVVYQKIIAEKLKTYGLNISRHIFVITVDEDSTNIKRAKGLDIELGLCALHPLSLLIIKAL